MPRTRFEGAAPILRVTDMKSSDEQGCTGTWAWIGVEDVQSLYEEYRASGAKVRHPPRNYPWALEMHVEDPDSHVLRFGSEPLPDRPFDAWEA
jgi:uncharacterized glyoxalase superfamily protein PhnB